VLSHHWWWSIPIIGENPYGFWPPRTSNGYQKTKFLFVDYPIKNQPFLIKSTIYHYISLMSLRILEPIVPQVWKPSIQPYPDAPWCWNIYVQNWAIFRLNVGVYIPAPWFASGPSYNHISGKHKLKYNISLTWNKADIGMNSPELTIYDHICLHKNIRNALREWTYSGAPMQPTGVLTW
jgi:hypothetical protein